MSEKAILTLRSGERLEVFPLDGATFASDLYQAVMRATTADWFEGRDASGARVQVRLGDVSTVRVVTADVIQPGRVWPPQLETKPATSGALCGVGGCTWTAGHAGLAHSWG